MLHKLNYYVSLTYFNIDLSTLITRLPYADYLQDKSNPSKKPAMELLIRYSSNCMSTTWWWQHLFKVYNAATRHAHQHHLSTVVAVWFTSPLGVQLQLSCIVCKLNLYYSQCCCSVLTNCHFFVGPYQWTYYRSATSFDYKGSLLIKWNQQTSFKIRYIKKIIQLWYKFDRIARDSTRHALVSIYESSGARRTFSWSTSV